MQVGMAAIRPAIPVTTSSATALDAIDLFVVETPMQLLNALEAHAYFHSVKSTLLIIVTEAFSRERFDQLLSALPGKPWKEIRFVRLKTRFAGPGSSVLASWIPARVVDIYNEFQRLLNRKRLDAHLASIPPGARVFLGNYLEIYKGYLRHVANFVRPSGVVLLDDGTEAILINKQRVAWARAGNESRGDPSNAGTTWFQRFKRRMRARHVDWDDKHYAAVTFFSAFPLATSDSDRLVRNEYAFLRSIKKAQRVSDEILVIGQCLPEDGYLHTGQYVSDVVGLCRHFAGRQVVYIPHPRESQDTVDRVVQATGASIRRLAVPVELALLTAPELPQAVVSFCSTALINCSAIFGSQLAIYASQIDLDSLRCHRSEVAEVYERMNAMRSETFRILEAA
jgi:Alpha-2,8-polysialyltransferase (POLYST)